MKQQMPTPKLHHGIFFLLAMVLLSATFQNCSSGVNFSQDSNQSLSSVTTPDPAQTICNSFSASSSTSCDVSKGLLGTLYIQPRSTLTLQRHGGSLIPAGETSIQDYLSQPSWISGTTTDGVFTPYTIVAPTIDTIATPFANGFSTADGGTVMIPDGNGSETQVAAWFAIDLKGSFRLGPNDPPGTYQFAVIADDAAQIYYQTSSSSGWQILVDDQTPKSVVNPGGYLPGTQYARMGCSSVFNETATIITVPMTATTAVPMRVSYYQGPIGLTFKLMYRQVPSTGPVDTYCETDINQTPSLKSTVVKPSPVLNESKLSGDGWQDTTSANWGS